VDNDSETGSEPDDAVGKKRRGIRLKQDLN
jgi:hypothetical protein